MTEKMLKNYIRVLTSHTNMTPMDCEALAKRIHTLLNKEKDIHKMAFECAVEEIWLGQTSLFRRLTKKQIRAWFITTGKRML